MKLNLTIRTKLLGGFGLLLLLAASFAVVSSWQLTAMEQLQRQTEGKIALLAQRCVVNWELGSFTPLQMWPRR